jgi:hypothetical protein
MVGGASVRSRGERRCSDVIQLIGVQGDCQTGVARRLGEGPHLVDVEDAVLDERIHRFGQSFVGNGPNGQRGIANEAATVIDPRRGKRVQREIRHRDVDAGLFRRGGDDAQLAELLAWLESIAALHLDRRCAERDRSRQATSYECEQLVIARLARRAHRRVDAASALEDGEVVGAALPRHELVPALARIAEMRMCVDEAGHDDAPLGVDLDRVSGAIKFLPAVSATRRDNDAVACREPSAFDRAHIACRRADTRLLVTERCKREKPSASDDEIGFHYSDGRSAAGVANEHRDRGINCLVRRRYARERHPPRSAPDSHSRK